MCVWGGNQTERSPQTILVMETSRKPHCRHVRPGGGFIPKFQLFEKGDVNGDKEQKVFTFLKVRGSLGGQGRAG